MTDKIKFALALLLVVAGVVAFYMLGALPLFVRVLCFIAGVAAGAVTGWFTEPGRQFAGFARDAWNEARKVVWPSKAETRQTTLAVFGFVVAMAVVLFIIDKSVETIIYKLILNWKS